MAKTEQHDVRKDLERLKKRLQASEKSLLDCERKAEDLEAAVHSAKRDQRLRWQQRGHV
jgi:hypothetical protein